MKMEDAINIMKSGAGFRVTFERQEGGMLISDHFPDNDEDGISTEEEAWTLAKMFATINEHKGIVNVYVINAFDYTPVENYKERKLNTYPQP